MTDIVKQTDTFWCKIYIAGPLGVIEQVCREHCFKIGLCVTVTPTKYIFTRGEETGAEIGLINYPPYPCDFRQIENKALDLAVLIMETAYQGSFTIVTPTKTTFYSRRPQDASENTTT